MSRYSKILVCFMLLGGPLAIASAAAAQQTESRIVGRISDANGGSLPGVTVTITSVLSGAVRTFTTDAEGRYAVTNLGPGEYDVKAEVSGFAPNKGRVVLGVGDVKPLDLTLSVVGVSEEVTVTARSTVVDMTSARIGVNVSPEELKNLPVNGRNFANLMTLATGATSDGNGGYSWVADETDLPDDGDECTVDSCADGYPTYDAAPQGTACATGVCDGYGYCCTPIDCSEVELECGRVSDGCNGTLSCGSCSAPEWCGGAGDPTSCGCSTFGYLGPFEARAGQSDAATA